MSPLPPVVVGGAIVVPAGLIAERTGQGDAAQVARETKRVELAAMQAVLAHEIALGHRPRDVSDENLGWDIESRAPDGRLRFIEVKGRVAGADTVTVTRNEILAAANKGDDFLLAIVHVDGSHTAPPIYLPSPFDREVEFSVTAQIYSIPRLLERVGRPIGTP